MTVLIKTMNRTQKLLMGLVAMAHIGDRIPLLQVESRGINIMHEKPGPKRKVITNSPLSAFELFLSEEIVEEVCKCTNLEGRRVATSRRKRWSKVSQKEVLAYFRLVLFS